MITTTDNKFDPFTQYDEWLRYDHDKRYNTIELLARIAKVSDNLSELDYLIAKEIAIDTIINEKIPVSFAENETIKYKKVYYNE